MTCALALFVPAILVDPTTYVGSLWPRKPQLCERGIRVDARTGKLLALTAVRPQELLLGNSRVANGFAEHATIQQLGHSVMNLGLAGATLEEMEVALEQGLHSGVLRRVWIGIDYGMFEQHRPQLVQALESSLLARLRKAIANPDAIGMSYAALAASCHFADMSVHGFVGPTRYVKQARTVGWERVLTRSRIAMERAFADIALDDPAHRATLGLARRATLARMLGRAQAANVEVILFAGPAHLQYFEAIRRAGLGTDFQRWRDELQTLDARNGVSVFDFSDYAGTHDTELAACNPAQDKDCSMYDVNHYQPAVGAHMLDVMLQSLRAAAS
jgi:hypothetical protein